MMFIDRVIHLVLSGIIIVGVYQFYFFTQRHMVRPVKTFNSALDEKFLSGPGGPGYTAFFIIRRFSI